MAIDPNDHPHHLQLPQVCCSCLGDKELMRKVSSFYGEEGKSLEAQFVAIGRPFEPTSFLKGHFRFRNQEYQKKFEELNAVSTSLPKREAR